MKKTVCILLVTLMILACLPLTAGAAVASTDVCKIGDTGYATLDAAVAAVKDGETIVLLKDATLTALNQNAINYTIDGQNKTYSVSTKGTSSGYYINVGQANVTFKDVKVELGSDGWSILQNDTNKTGDLTFDNCQVKAYNNSFFKLNGKGNFTLKNTTWDKMTGSATAFYFRADHATVGENECVITLENSTITNHAGDKSQLQNNGIFHLNSSAGSTVKFYLKGNTVLKNASETANATVACVFYNEKPNATIKIYADSTAKLELAPTSTSIANVYFVYTASGATTLIYGTPKLVTNANVSSKGVYLPQVTGVYSADGSVLYNKFSDGTNQYDYGYKYSGTATSFTPVSNIGNAEGAEACIKKSNGAIYGYYSSLASAITAVQNGDTVVLMKNATLTALNTNAINYTVDGQNKTFTLTTAAGTVNIGNSNVTFKDLKIEMGPSGQTTLQCDTNMTGDVTFDNCQIKTYNNSFYKLNGKGNFTLKNSTYDKMTGDATVFYFRGDHASVSDNECVITVENSTITNYAGKAGQIQNNAIFHWNSSAGSTVKFYLKGNTVLKNASETANLTATCLFHNQQSGSTMIINAEPTVQLIMDQKPTTITNATVIYSAPGATTKLIGTPTYVINDNVAKRGFKIHNADAKIMYSNNGKLIGYGGSYTDGSGNILISGDVAAGKLTKGISVKPVVFASSDFDMQNGAALRTQDGRGLRFSTNVSDALIAALGDNAIFGTLLAKKDMIIDKGVELTLNNVDANEENPTIVNTVSTKSKWQNEGNGKVYRIALINIPDTAYAYATQIVARAYMTVTYFDGTSKTFYTDVDADNVRSMYNVAENLDNSSLEIVSHIKNTVSQSGISAPTPDWPGKSIDIYIIAGQSNAAGTTIYNESVLSSLWPNYKTGVDSVKLYGYCEQTIPEWTNAKAGQGGSTSKIGPEAGIAATIASYYNGEHVAGILKHTHGGTSLFNNTSGYNAVKGNWVSPSYAQYKGYTYSGLTGGLYRGLIDQVESGVYLLEQEGYDNVNIKGVFWMQGESDRGNPTEYEIAFKYFVSDLRRDLGEVMDKDMSELPIMVGEISRTTASAEPSSVVTNEKFIAMQRGLATKINNVYIISSGQYEINQWDGTKDTNGQDAWHWTTKPMFEIGCLVGDCILEKILKVK